MSLKLVTGPANAAKAGVVLGGLRARLDDEPVLVVPAFEDVEHNQRELAARGAVFGARVLRFKALFALIASRAGAGGRVASPLQRELVVAEAVRDARLEEMAESAERPGFVRAAARFVAELERSMVEPARLTSALRRWAGDGPRRRYADELAEIYRRYRDRLAAAGLVDEDLRAWSAVEALREAPTSWGATPVFVYGFDDFTPLELAALDALANAAGAEVVVSLPHEAGREAFRATRAVHARLLALGAREQQELPALSDHYADESRAALHALERGLFEDGAATADPGDAVGVHLAGGRRAEVELCAAAVLDLLRDGTQAGDVAVVMRDPRAYASTVEQVFDAYGIPYSIDRALPLRHTGVGRGLLALLRCASGSGSADDLLAYLRTPGRLREPAYADRLEAALRRDGRPTAQRARELWDEEVGPFPLAEIDRLAAVLDDPPELLAELGARLERLFAGPYMRAAHVLEGPEIDDARAFRAAHGALSDMRALALAGARLDARRVEETLAALDVRVGEPPQPGRVTIAAPEGIRARRFEAVFVCGLQEGELPAAGRPEPFLSDADRREIARATGLALPLREDQLERERYLFYVCASRAERRLVLSARTCGEEGEPEAQSFFLDDVERIFPGLRARARRRSLSDVTWAPEDAPTEAEWERAVAARKRAAPPRPIAPLALDAALAALRGRGPVSAGAIERFAGCPVSWLVQDVLRPVELEPDPERMVQGAYAHSVLELTFRRLRERTGDRGVAPANLDVAELILLEALEEQAERYALASSRARVRAALRRLEFELLRHLRHEADTPSEFEPDELELTFGLGEDGHPAVDLGDGLLVRGRIDRVDRRGGEIAVRDYKSGRVGSYSAASWEAKGRLQAALYMAVAERLLDAEAVAGLYTPLAGTDRRSRGAVRADSAADLGGDFVAGDVLGDDDFEALRAWAGDAIATAAREMEEGRLCSKPDSCAYRGGCSHPSICRIER
ncbi:MAG: PD-(D/E)XK nuclease family protein [Thermoleophilaceae bacterium]